MVPPRSRPRPPDPGTCSIAGFCPASRATAFSAGAPGAASASGTAVPSALIPHGHLRGQPGGPGGQLSDPVIEDGDLVQVQAGEQRPLHPTRNLILILVRSHPM